MRHLRRISLPVLCVLAAACESTPTLPVVEMEAVEQSLSVPARDGRYTPLLPRLFEGAVARVRTERGDALATQLSAEYRGLVQAARDARAAGDAETARKRSAEAQGAAARVVSRVVPNATGRVLENVTSQLAKLEARIASAEANGRDAGRFREVLERATRLRDAARGELAGGRAVPALVHATGAADLLAGLGSR